MAKSSKNDWENTFQNKGIMFLLIQSTKPLKTAGSFLKKIIMQLKQNESNAFFTYRIYNRIQNYYTKTIIRLRHIFVKVNSL